MPDPELAIDLLHFRQAPAPNAALRQATAFAFATADTSGAIDHALVRGLDIESSWNPGDFSKDLFLGECIERGFQIQLPNQDVAPEKAFLQRVLLHPPSDVGVLERRQAIVHELGTSPGLRAHLARACEKFRTLKSLLCSAPIGRGTDVIRRRLDILGAVGDVVKALAEGTEPSRTALGDVRQFARALTQSPGFQRMADLLAHENEMAVLDVQLRLGSDGHLRGLSIVRATENRHSAFYSSPLRRLAQRLVQFIRGYGFTNNEIIGSLVESVFQGIEGGVLQLLELHAQLEVYLAVVGFRNAALREGLDVCLPRFVLPGERGPEIFGLWNPLLLRNVRPVPCDLRVSRSDASVIVTGPNSGGKTRLLQALALTQLLGQGGFYVPAKSATLQLAPTLHVSLIEEAAPDQREGRLGTELLRIRKLFEHLRPGSLVLLDELCSGTNPTEGERIFELVLSLFAEVRPQAFIATHYLDFAARLEARREPHNVEFLEAVLDPNHVPTYAFGAGVARSSLANQTAVRLGVTAEELRSLAKAAFDQQEAQRGKRPLRVPVHPSET